MAPSFQDLHPVMDEILAFLSWEEMKAFSILSKGTLGMVRSSPAFLKRTTLNVTRKLWEGETERNSFILGFPWKHLTLEVDPTSIPSSQQLAKLGGVFGSALSLHLYISERRDGRYHLQSDEDTGLSQFLIKMEKLVTLKIEEGLLFRLNSAIWDNERAKKLFRRLQHIHICGFRHIFYDFIGRRRGYPNFRKNFHQLLLAPTHLKSFVLNSDSQLWQDFRPGPGRLQLIPPNMMMLEQLHLNLLEGDGPVARLREDNIFASPKLKSLTLNLSEFWAERQEIAEIISNLQPKLEELSIYVVRSSIPECIMQLLQHETLLCSRLKKLHLRFSHELSIDDCQFLKRFSVLEDISIKGSDDTFSGEDILDALPLQVQKLSLSCGNNFWNLSRWDGPEESEPNIGELLLPFDDLRELDLDCGHFSSETVTDAGLQSLIRNCPKLTSLSFNASSLASNFGITGVDKEHPEIAGLPLSHLTRLKHLKMIRCSNIDAESLLAVIKFELLRSFIYREKETGKGPSLIPNPKPFVLQVARQNPSLEIISLSLQRVGKNIPVEKVPTQDVQKINPRVRQVSIYDNHCHRIPPPTEFDD